MGVKKLKLLRAAVVFLSFSFMAQGEAKAGTFSFTKIADSQDIYNDFQTPSINNNGIIAFSSRLDTDPQLGVNIEAVYTSDGTNTKTIFQGRISPNFPPYFQKDFFTIPSIDDKDRVTVTRFFNTVIPGLDSYSILLGDGRTQSELANFPGADRRSGAGKTSDPSINNNGEVVVQHFDNPTPGFGNLPINELVILNSQGQVIKTIILPLPQPFPRTGGEDRAVPDEYAPLINDAGVVAHIFEDKLSLFDGTTTELSAKTFQGLSLNNLGKVSFVAEELDGFSGSPNSGIFTFDGTNISKVVDADGIFNSFKNTSINDGGAVAFLANLDNGNLGIFSGEDRVISVGDRLFGSTISSLKFNREGLNNSGQLAFYAEFTDGKKGIFRADIVQHSTPESSTVVGVLFIGLIGWQKVKSSC